MFMELIHEEFMVLKQAFLYDPCPETTNTISSNTSSLILTESRQELNLQLPEGWCPLKLLFPADLIETVPARALTTRASCLPYVPVSRNFPQEPMDPIFPFCRPIFYSLFTGAKLVFDWNPNTFSHRKNFQTVIRLFICMACYCALI